MGHEAGEAGGQPRGPPFPSHQPGAQVNERDLNVYNTPSPRAMGAWISGDTSNMFTEDRIQRLRVPDWLTDRLAADLYRTSKRWQHAGYSESDLHIEIPVEWVPQEQRHYYGPGAKLFGIDLRLSGHTTEAQVSVTVASR